MAGIAGKGRFGRAAYWREQIALCEASGRSIAGYCREAGLSASTYYWWKGELKRRDGVVRCGPVGVASLFAEVAVAQPASAPELPLEVVLAGERVIRVPRGFDAGTLAEVVRVLEGLSC